jgi:ABC-type sugar transport system substrate-binding protein
MMRKTIAPIAVAVLLAALTATLIARPSGAARRKYTIAYLTYVNYARGGREAAKRLGVRIVLGSCPHGPGSCSPSEAVRLYKSMIARHVDAIVSDGYNPALTPVFRKVRKAGILLISSGDDIAGKRDLWVGPSDPVAYGQALADALASQIGKKGEYAILDEQGEFPIAERWKRIVAAYILKAYPKMKLDGMLTETGVGDQNEIDSVKSFMADHPHLKGLIAVTPTETYMAGEAITQAGRIGQVFSASNGGSTLSDPQLRGYVRSGAAELVFVDNPIKLGYLDTWAAHYLLAGHHFRFGEYQVGGPIGGVWYYPKHRELRLGQPLTITKKNLDFYAKKF